MTFACLVGYSQELLPSDKKIPVLLLPEREDILQDILQTFTFMPMAMSAKRPCLTGCCLKLREAECFWKWQGVAEPKKRLDME